MQEMKYSVPAAVGKVNRQLGGRRQQIDGGIRVTHSEQIAVVTSTAGFTSYRYLVQPGLSTFSDWLSTEAGNFDQYRVVSLIAEYEPRCGTDNSGSVAIGWDFDPSDRQPTSSAAFSSYYETIEGPPWLGTKTTASTSAIHATGPRKYLRSTTVSGDLRAYDACSLLLCLEGGPTTPITWGKLWVHYVIDLLVPTAPAPPTVTQAFSFVGNGTTNVNNATVVVPINTSGYNFNGAFELTDPTVTASVAGTYMITLNGSMGATAVTAGGSVNVQLTVNGTVINTNVGGFPAGVPGGTFQNFIMVTVWRLQAGDIVGVQVFSNMASNVAVQAGTDLIFLCV